MKIPRVFSEFSTTFWVKILIGLGIFLRLFQMGANNALFHDEALLAQNINNLTFHELTGVLAFNQAAPIGFLWATKAVVFIFGDMEFSFRLLPLLIGIASIFLFWKLVQQLVSKNFALLALAFFVFNNYLIFYAVTLKQYGFDVAATLVLFLLFLKILNPEKRNPYFFYIAAAGSLLIWFSQPSIFVLVGGTVACGLFFMQKKDFSSLKRLSLASTLWLGSFAIYFFLFLQPSISNDLLQSYHSKYFMPLQFWKLENWKWYTYYYFYPFAHPGDIHFRVIGGVIALLGMVWSIRQTPSKYLIFLLPVALAFGASAFGKYSVIPRLLLFAIPTIIIFLIKGLEQLTRFRKINIRYVYILGSILLLQPFLNSTIHNLAKPPKIEEIKSPLQFITDNKQAGDVLYVYFHAEPQFGYYKSKYDLEGLEIIIGINPYDPNLRADLAQLKGKKRVWVLLSHFKRMEGVYDDKIYHDIIQEFANKKLEKRDVGAVCYLYEI